MRSPVKAASDTLYADLRLDAGASVNIPADAEERAIYMLDGDVAISGDRFPSDRLLVFRPGDEIVVGSERGAHFMLFGGASLGSQRYIWWNFVSSSKERIEQAKQNGRPAVSISFRATRKNSSLCRKISVGATRVSVAHLHSAGGGLFRG